MKRYAGTLLLCLTAVLLSSSAHAAEVLKTAPKADVTPTPAASSAQGATPATKPNLDFDLLDPPGSSGPKVPLAPPVDEALVKRRRLMLTLHQAVGSALAVAMVGSMVTGQLNYDDKFLGQNSGRYELAHKAFVFPTEALAAVTAGLAIFAPVPIEKKGHGFDRMTLHKIGQFTAFAGWAAELGLGLATANREGYANQRALATAHLAIGYVTLAGVLLGLGAITF